MSNQAKKNCCKDCKSGSPGTNPTCKAKLMIEALNKQEDAKLISSKN